MVDRVGASPSVDGCVAIGSFLFVVFLIFFIGMGIISNTQLVFALVNIGGGLLIGLLIGLLDKNFYSE